MGSVGISARKIMSVVGFDGKLVELPVELKYGEMITKIPSAMQDFERKRATSKVEYGMLTDSKGRVLEEKRGGKGVVTMSTEAYMKATTFSHIHPEEQNSLSGTFSPDDIGIFNSFDNLRTIRAVAKEGTYSLTKDAGFNDNLNEIYAKAYQRISDKADREIEQARNLADATQTKLAFDYHLGKISYEEMSKQWDAISDNYDRACQDANNKYLIGLHNWFINNQQKYGYKYSLEKRR